MKTLVDYIKEACEDGSCKSKTFKFNFTDLESAEDTIKAVQEIADKDGVKVEIEDNIVNVTVDANDTDKAEGLFELLQDYSHKRMSDSKRASDESYAQKTSKFEATLNKWRDFIDDLEAPADDDNDDDKKDDADKKEEE